MDRLSFGDAQKEMTASWVADVKRRFADPDAYYAVRFAAYLGRWREALRFVAPGARVLDVGGGNMFPSLFELLREHDVDYWYLDVDDEAAAASAVIARRHGFEASRFAAGYNDALGYDDERFDAVFSSHCIEHSFDLVATFDEVNRVLKPGGMLLMAVPFGWEANPEHPYFFGPDEWAALVEDAGFDIRLTTIAKEYPENGHDYFVAARKTGPRRGSRIYPGDYDKRRYRFAGLGDARLTLDGPWERADGFAIGRAGAVVRFAAEGARTVLPVVERHDWSGVLEVADAASRTVHDLYSRFSYTHPAMFTATGEGEVTMRAIGRNAASHDRQIVLYGVLHDGPEAPAAPASA